MANPSSSTEVRLIDAQALGRPFVSAVIYRAYPTVELENVESLWAEARDRSAAEGAAAGLTPIVH